MRWDFKHRTADAFESRIGEARAGRLGAAQRVVPICRRQGQGLCQVQAGREGDVRRGGQVGGVHAGPDKGPCRGRGGDSVRREARGTGRCARSEGAAGGGGRMLGRRAGVKRDRSGAGAPQQALMVPAAAQAQARARAGQQPVQSGRRSRYGCYYGTAAARRARLPTARAGSLSGAGGEERRSAPLGQARGRLGRAEAPPAAPAPMHWTWHA